MKVMIAGSAGQLGRALVATAPGNAQLLACSRQDLDIGNRDAVAELVERERPDWILNAAAYTAVDKAESERDAAFAINSAGVRYLAEAATRSGSRLLHVSTDFVFDGTQASPYRPDAKPNPVSAYGESKLAGEREAASGTAGKAVVVRTAWVYDATGRNFLTTMLRLMKERDSLGIVQDQVGTPTWSVSLAHCCWQLVAQDVAGGIYHWTDAGVASWYDFAVAIQEEALALDILAAAIPVRPIRTSDYPTPARRPSYSVLDRTDTEAAAKIVAGHWRTALRRALLDLADARPETGDR